MTRKEFIGGLVAAAGTGCCTMTSRSGGLRLVQMGDPQFGFGNPREDASVAYANDLRRFEAAVERVNDLRPDVVVLNGDLTNRPEDLVREWPRLLKRFAAPVVVTPGNHDLGNRVSRENLERFRRVFGYDRTSLDVKGWRLIAGNSQFWFDNDLAEETRAYADWVAAERARARSSGGRVILATHYPPFELYLGEADSWRNRPKAGRVESVNAWLDAGARFWIAGHTHTMISRAHCGLVLLNAETTSRNFDARPFGFRLLTIRDDFSWDWDFFAV